MSAEDVGMVHSSTDGGVAGVHPGGSRELFVGSATPDQRNLITTGIIPIACWRVDDVRFEFDSSFVRPDVAEDMKNLMDLREQHKLELNRTNAVSPAPVIFPPLSIFGHADPVGDDDYNKKLTGRRAAAIYGLLTRDTRLWEELYSQPLGHDAWGMTVIQIMLTELGFPADGRNRKGDEATREAVKKFQQANGLAADGDPGPKTREKLFLSYMDKLCGQDVNGQDFKLDKEDHFLARAKDAAGKGDYQGCSEFNPILLFSDREEQEFKQADEQAERDAANAPNRRVMVLLFRPGSWVNPAKWPCPRVKEGVAGCKKRFWSDGEKRRSSHLPDERRDFGKTKDTFACRFYHRLSIGSPCERILASFKIRLFDRLAKPIPQAPYIAVIKGKERPPGQADANGDITLHDVEVPSACIVRWGQPDDTSTDDSAAGLDEFDRASLLADGLTEEEIQKLREAPPPAAPVFEFEREVFLDLDKSGAKEAIQETATNEDAARLRLHNLGYSVEAELEENIRLFQRDCGKQETGILAQIEAELKKRHKDCNPPPRFKS